MSDTTKDVKTADGATVATIPKRRTYRVKYPNGFVAQVVLPISRDAGLLREMLLNHGASDGGVDANCERFSLSASEHGEEAVACAVSCDEFESRSDAVFVLKPVVAKAGPPTDLSISSSRNSSPSQKSSDLNTGTVVPRPASGTAVTPVTDTSVTDAMIVEFDKQIAAGLPNAFLTLPYFPKDDAKFLAGLTDKSFHRNIEESQKAVGVTQKHLSRDLVRGRNDLLLAMAVYSCQMGLMPRHLALLLTRIGFEEMEVWTQSRTTGTRQTTIRTLKAKSLNATPVVPVFSSFDKALIAMRSVINPKSSPTELVAAIVEHYLLPLAGSVGVDCKSISDLANASSNTQLELFCGVVRDPHIDHFIRSSERNKRMTSLQIFVDQTVLLVESIQRRCVIHLIISTRNELAEALKPRNASPAPSAAGVGATFTVTMPAAVLDQLSTDRLLVNTIHKRVKSSGLGVALADVFRHALLSDPMYVEVLPILRSIITDLMSTDVQIGKPFLLQDPTVPAHESSFHSMRQTVQSLFRSDTVWSRRASECFRYLLQQMTDDDKLRVLTPARHQILARWITAIDWVCIACVNGIFSETLPKLCFRLLQFCDRNPADRDTIWDVPFNLRDGAVKAEDRTNVFLLGLVRSLCTQLRMREAHASIIITRYRFLLGRRSKLSSSPVDGKRLPPEICRYATAEVVERLINDIYFKTVKFANHVMGSRQGQCQNPFVLAVGFDKGEAAPVAVGSSPDVRVGAAIILFMSKLVKDKNGASFALGGLQAPFAFDSVFYRSVRTLTAQVLFPTVSGQTLLKQIDPSFFEMWLARLRQILDASESIGKFELDQKLRMLVSSLTEINSSRADAGEYQIVSTFDGIFGKTLISQNDMAVRIQHEIEEVKHAQLLKSSQSNIEKSLRALRKKLIPTKTGNATYPALTAAENELIRGIFTLHDETGDCAESSIASHLVGGDIIAILFGRSSSIGALNGPDPGIVSVQIDGKDFDFTAPRVVSKSNVLNQDVSPTHRYWIHPCTRQCTLSSVGHVLLSDLVHWWHPLRAEQQPSPTHDVKQPTATATVDVKQQPATASVLANLRQHVAPVASALLGDVSASDDSESDVSGEFDPIDVMMGGTASRSRGRIK